MLSDANRPIFLTIPIGEEEFGDAPRGRGGPPLAEGTPILINALADWV